MPFATWLSTVAQLLLDRIIRTNELYVHNYTAKFELNRQRWLNAWPVWCGQLQNVV